MSSPAVNQPSLLSQWDHSARIPEIKTVADDSGHDEYPATSEDSLLPPNDFQPFFTLIEDTGTGEHHHPHLQYVFSDDDPDTVTTAIVDSSQTAEEPNLAHRVILVDVHQDGKHVASIHSLSPHWQVSGATITQAPSWNEAATQEAVTHGLMLKISGAENPTRMLEETSASGQEEDSVTQMELVMTGYAERMARLRALLDAHHLDDQDMPADTA